MGRLIDVDDLMQYAFGHRKGLIHTADIDKIPPAQPERPKGEWVFPYGNKRYKKCAVCGRIYYSIPSDSNFCPNCGADMRQMEMRGEQDE